MNEQGRREIVAAMMTYKGAYEVLEADEKGRFAIDIPVEKRNVVEAWKLLSGISNNVMLKALWGDTGTIFEGASFSPYPFGHVLWDATQTVLRANKIRSSFGRFTNRSKRSGFALWDAGSGMTHVQIISDDLRLRAELINAIACGREALGLEGGR